MHLNLQMGIQRPCGTVAAASSLTAQTNADIKWLNYEIDKQNADTKKYEAETDRMKLMGDY